MAPPRRRLDRQLVQVGLAPDATRARELIAERRVLVDGSPGLQAGMLVAESSAVTVEATTRYVTRGGLKLDGALEDLGVAVGGRRCLDAGAGVGGFTDCLLQHGAASVTAVDVGYGDFDWRLRQDPRVTLFERSNLRTMDAAALGEPFDLVVADLSFISLEAVAGQLVAATALGGALVLLVKPQFEAPRGDVGARGIVRDPAVQARAVERVVAALRHQGAETLAEAPSRLTGTHGNQEFFVHARRRPPVDGGGA
ncbi:MAG TPA: TlyA family RNA methyltransferase [Actinomycetota bacterium]|nr:TlyA family RNA methyltransferase [Actinomycetota bacterium]